MIVMTAEQGSRGYEHDGSELKLAAVAEGWVAVALLLGGDDTSEGEDPNQLPGANPGPMYSARRLGVCESAHTADLPAIVAEV